MTIDIIKDEMNILERIGGDRGGHWKMYDK